MAEEWIRDAIEEWIFYHDNPDSEIEWDEASPAVRDIMRIAANDFLKTMRKLGVRIEPQEEA